MRPYEKLPTWLRTYVTEKDVILSSGRPSDWFIDIKAALLGPDFGRILARMMTLVEPVIEAEYFHRGEPMGIVGPELGGAVLAILMHPYFKRVFVVRKETHDTGVKKLIEGPTDWKGGVVVVDDVATTGHTLIKTVALCEAAGHQVRFVAAVIDRGGGGAVSAAGYEFGAAWTLRDEAT